jgi:hypothetical protein
MKKKFRLLIMCFVCLIIGSTGSWSAVQGKEQRPTISAGERAEIAWQVQNVMSKHAYYKQVNLHCEEMADIWVRENGTYDKTATWTSKYGVEIGLAQIKLNYCTACEDDKKKKLEEVSKIYPAIKNSPENIGIGYMYFMHTNLTPVIEVAGDGKTAKGIWYSIGLSVTPNFEANGKTTIRSNWQPEKYAVDFVKEDGEWKIWHFINLFEPGPTEGTQEFNMEMVKAHGTLGVVPGEQAPTGMGIVHYVTKELPGLYSWSPTTVPQIFPKFPEPYYTFSETFSY